MKNPKPKKVSGPLSKDPPQSSADIDRTVAESMLIHCDKVSSERYQAFIENIQEGVYEVDIHGNFLYFNNSLCRVFGYPREEIQFCNFSKFMTEDYAKKAFATFNKIYQTGQGFSDLIWEIKDKEGEARIIELSANQITDQSGKTIGFRGIARDITGKFRIQRALQESERRYRTLLDFVPHPIVVFTLDGRVSYLNPAFTKIFGWTLEELEG
ncbi:MAG: PAS domain-containing protein, partial [Desulfobacteraceae bacterium]|nr:PAS domain-containing protein [Desulfobacteraceae bacterium]